MKHLIIISILLQNTQTFFSTRQRKYFFLRESSIRQKGEDGCYVTNQLLSGLIMAHVADVHLETMMDFSKYVRTFIKPCFTVPLVLPRSGTNLPMCNKGITKVIKIDVKCIIIM